jgi:flagellar basal-body rod modification protein FlgD
MSVMNVKRGTQTFSKAEQSAGLKSDGAIQAGAEDFKKAYGDQSLGDVLNKAADPNYIDPSKKVRGTGNNQLDKDAFLKLMLTQMKNQDPTNPMPSHEMAAQLAQFTSLEQLNNIHTTLESMKNAASPNSNYQALAFIGKKVSGDSAKVTRAAGDTKHVFSFDLMGDAAKMKVTIKDASGTVVRKLEFPAMKKGQNTAEWNGLTDAGAPARSGEYKIVIEAQGANGGKVYAKTAFEGRITGLNYSPEGPVLLVGKQSVKLSDVKKIEDAGPEDAMTGAAGEMLKPSEMGAMIGAGAAGASQPAPIKPLETKPLSAAQMNTANQLPTNTQAAAHEIKAGEKAGANAADAKNAETEKAVIRPPSAAGQPKDNEIPPAPDAEAETPGNIADVPMAGDLLKQVAKAQLQDVVK